LIEETEENKQENRSKCTHVGMAWSSRSGSSHLIITTTASRAH